MIGEASGFTDLLNQRTGCACGCGGRVVVARGGGEREEEDKKEEGKEEESGHGDEN